MDSYRIKSETALKTQLDDVSMKYNELNAQWLKQKELFDIEIESYENSVLIAENKMKEISQQNESLLKEIEEYKHRISSLNSSRHSVTDSVIDSKIEKFSSKEDTMTYDKIIASLQTENNDLRQLLLKNNEMSTSKSEHDRNLVKSMTVRFHRNLISVTKSFKGFRTLYIIKPILAIRSAIGRFVNRFVGLFRRK